MLNLYIATGKTSRDTMSQVHKAAKRYTEPQNQKALESIVKVKY